MAKSVSLNGGRRFTVALRQEKEGGYSVRCLELPQAISQGETKAEALTNIKEAIELSLEHLKARERAKKSEFIEVVV
ncbi:MAG TPA: type II toxin-antitoxin system HicB family antitoxin [Nitrososphaerales archaeon]|nr:type II toxin-antitoxin system HicB family antitoxin [Nitrososphaerales archaeon]